MAVKNIIVLKESGVITNIVNSIDETEQGTLVEDANGKYIIGFIDLCNIYEDVEVAEDVVIQKYKYDGITFSLNENYIAPNKTIDEQLQESKDEIADLKTDFNNAIIELSMAIAMTNVGV